MLSIDLRTTKSNNISNAIKQYISLTYEENPVSYEDDLKKFESYRNEICNTLPVCGNSINVLYRYYGQLLYLCAKFPLDDNNVSFRISFIFIFFLTFIIL